MCSASYDDLSSDQRDVAKNESRLGAHSDKELTLKVAGKSMSTATKIKKLKTKQKKKSAHTVGEKLALTAL